LVIPDVNKKNVIQGANKLGKKDVTCGQANSTGMPPFHKSKKAEELTYLSTNIGKTA
jgi:hypothetical protein